MWTTTAAPTFSWSGWSAIRSRCFAIRARISKTSPVRGVAGQEFGWSWPSQVRIVEAVAGQRGCDKRRTGQRPNIETAEEIVHRRVARYQHLAERFAPQHPS